LVWCCSNLFANFKFEDLTCAQPPAEKGVYVIKIKNKNNVSPNTMVNKTHALISKLGWRLVQDFIMDRVNRLKNIEDCPIIYIGSAGFQRGSRNTLIGRYTEFSGRHTIMYPIWVLLYFGWKLEFGWKVCDDPKLEEDQLKKQYKKLHSGKLPALVSR